MYRLTGSASLTALVSGLEAAPYVVFGLLAGALSDRWNRRRTMVTADLLGAVVLASIPLAHVLDVLTVPHILVVAFLGPTLATFFDGASFGAVPTLVGRDRIGQANSYVWTVQGLAEVVTPAAAGVALAVVHPSMLLALDALSYLVSGLLVLGIRRPMQLTSSDGQPVLTTRQVVADIGEGLRFLWHHTGVRTMTVVGFTQCISGGGFVALMVVWADQQLEVGTQGLRFGIVYGSWAVGSVVASIVLPRLLRRSSPARVLLCALPVSAVLGIVAPVWHTWWLGGLSLLTWSVAYTMVVINSITYRQQVTPEPLMSRVNTTGRMLSFGLGWPVGSVLGGVVAQLTGPREAMLAGAAVLALGVVLAWTSPLRHEGSAPAVMAS